MRRVLLGEELGVDVGIEGGRDVADGSSQDAEDVKKGFLKVSHGRSIANGKNYELTHQLMAFNNCVV